MVCDKVACKQRGAMVQGGRAPCSLAAKERAHFRREPDLPQALAQSAHNCLRLWRHAQQALKASGRLKQRKRAGVAPSNKPASLLCQCQELRLEPNMVAAAALPCNAGPLPASCRGAALAPWLPAAARQQRQTPKMKGLSWELVRRKASL